MKPVQSFELGDAILTALGINDQNIRGFEIRCFVGEVPTIRIESMIEVEQDCSQLASPLKLTELGHAIRSETLPILPRS